MVYQVLARGWRPQKFEDVIGQDAVMLTLKNALISETLGHAYLFSGLRGVGKTTAARLLAKAVNCENGPTPTPCGECDACAEIAAGSCIDVIEVDGASNRGIDDVRELRELLRYRPTRDRYRVIIIDEVHMLTAPAFNALLKSLEEPPPYIIFILATTERQKMPSTILSRCQQLEFRAVGAKLIADHIQLIAAGEDFTVTPQAADSISRAAEGSVRDALSLLDQLRAFSSGNVDEQSVAMVLGVPQFEKVVNLIGTLASGAVGDGLALLREEMAAGHDPVVIYQETGRALRMAMHLAIDATLEPGLTGDQREYMVKMASGLGVNGLGRMLGLWLEHENLVREASNRELALEVACLRLSRWPSVKRIEAFLAGESDSGASAPPAGGRESSTSFSPPSAAPPKASSARSVVEQPAPETNPQAIPKTAKEKLADALWESQQPDLACAVESAEERLENGRLIFAFNGGTEAMGTVIENGRDEIEALCLTVFDDVNGVDVEVAESRATLENIVAVDEKVMLIQRVIGGDIVGIQPDDAG